MVIGDIRMALVGHWEDREVTESMTVSICLGSFTKSQITGEEGLAKRLSPLVLEATRPGFCGAGGRNLSFVCVRPIQPSQLVSLP